MLHVLNEKELLHIPLYLMFNITRAIAETTLDFLLFLKANVDGRRNSKTILKAHPEPALIKPKFSLVYLKVLSQELL
jgi:hypothetical protein